MSSFPGSGKADHLDLGDYNAVCFECGRKFKASMLMKHWQGYFVCESCWEPRQPQDFARAVPDNQTPPWVQPMPAWQGGTQCFPNGQTSYPDDAIPDCVMPDYVSPFYDPDVTS